MENSFNQGVVEFLKSEEVSLSDKMNSCQEKGISRYTALLDNYERVIGLIKKYDWELMYSEYSTEQGKRVAVWEQNGDGLIRNHKIWDIK